MTTKIIVQPRITKVTRSDNRITRLVRSIAVDVGGGEGGGVTQEYVDNGDAATLTSANLYADSAANDALTSANAATALVEDLAEVNAFKISWLEDGFDTLEQTVDDNFASLSASKADQSAFETLQDLVDTKATPADITAAVADLVGAAPEALDTLYEIAAALQGEQAAIDAILTALDNCVRFDAVQVLTTPQKEQARSNIGAEQAGVAAGLVAAITPASIGAATEADGVKARSALQSGDVAPVALSGSFSDLINKSALFNLVYSAYVIGSNTAILASDTLGEMLGKLQAQVDSKEPSISSGTTAQYWRGDKTWRSFATDVLGTALTGLSTVTATAVTAADTVLVGIGKLQGQITALATIARTGSYTDLINKPSLPPATTVVNITANRTILTTESGTIFADTSAGGAQFTFPTPAAAGNGWEVEIWNETGSASLTTKLNPPAGGQSIDGSTAQLIVYWKQGYRIVSDGTAYFTHTIRATRFYAEGAGTGARARAESAQAIAIGSGAIAGSAGALALGVNANAVNSTSIAIMGTAIGVDAIAVRGTTTGTKEIAIGAGSTTGTVLSSSGGSIALGNNASAQRDSAVAIGASSVASQIAEIAFPSWSFAVSNHKEIVLGNNSMTAASTDYLITSNNLNSASTANQITCPASSTVAFDGVLVVRRQGSGGTETASWKIEGEMTRQTTGNVSIVASTITALAGMTPPTGWTPSLVADTTNQCLSLKFNMGTTAMNLRGAAIFRYVTLTY